MIEWFAKNHVAANLLMFAIMAMGVLAVRNDLALELMPDFSLGTVTVSTILPGGNPESVEETITARIEEAVSDLEGVKKITSRSTEGFSTVSIELQKGYNEQNMLSDIKVRVDALNTLPSDAERPIISLAELPVQVIGVALYGDVSYDELFNAAATMREELLKVDGVTQVSDLQAPPREIHIEVDPKTLRQYNLTLEDIGIAIQRNSLDVSAGNLRTSNGDILVRTNGQSYNKAEFEAIPVFSSGDDVIYLKEIAKIVDGYQLLQVEMTYNGKPTITFEAFRIGKQNTITISENVQSFIKSYAPRLDPKLKIGTYGNTATVVKDRLDTLLSSALYGGLLVLIILSLFLRPAVAFWVGLGIPVSFLGGLAMMPILGLSMNMLTMFAFLLVLGIVVDDAIVTGENIYRHLREGKSPADAALIGTKEVAVPVTFGVITTMVAFAPLLLVQGIAADLAKQIPLIVIPVLAFSLIESKLILPSHMSTIKARSDDALSSISRWQQSFSRGFEEKVIRLYRPFLKRCINNKSITIVTAATVFFITVSSLNNGFLRVAFFPDFEDNAIFVKLTMPSTTGYLTTKKEIDRIANIAEDLSKEYIDPATNKSYFKYFIAVAGLSVDGAGIDFGSNKGLVAMEFEQGENGTPEGFSIKQVQEKLRTRIGEIPGAEKLSLSSSFGDFGRPISISLYGEDINRIGKLSDQVRSYLKSHPGIFDIQDNFSNGREEVKLSINELSSSLGLSQNDIANQVRNAVFGFEAQRIQRGPDEIKVMVRYPHEYRSSLSDVNNIPIKPPLSDNTIPLFELATLEAVQSPTSVYRDRQRRAVTVTADIDVAAYDVNIIRKDLRKFLDELFLYEPNISYNMDGQAESEKETVESFLLGFIAVMFAIYALLAIPFKSFGQPLVVMSIIPLAIVGAIAGHYLMGLSFSMLSIMGILGLTGIVVNDSLVLVDYINQRRAKGMPVLEAVLNAGETRFRPVMLTSITTFVGLLPLMLNQSVQAQELIPMAVSLGFGIIFATAITLVITPVNYLVGRKIKHAIINGFKAARGSLVRYWNKAA